MPKKNALPPSLKLLLEKGDTLYQTGISVDCVIFGFHEQQLKILLLKVDTVHKWALPGGFIKKTEPIEAAAYRVLQERTGVKDIFLQQFHVFGAPDRSDASIHQKRYLNFGVKIPKDNWLIQRFITVGFYALVDFNKVSIQPSEQEAQWQWMDIEYLNSLMMDHAAIVQKALETLRTQIAYLPIGKNLLPRKFTMPELQKLYETILNQKLDRRNFQRKLLSFGILNRLTETKKGGAHKAAYLYTFNEKKYQKALKEGLYGSW
ncbi:MAG: NUDIX hydrolase [Sediminibacterium sp.]|jgi:8-oxo-dGTP diphosphatase